MGFSLTGSHLIFFIASAIVASTVSGVLIAVTTNVSNSLSDRGDRLQEQLDTDFEIINDPDNIPTQSTNYVFYLKNTGGKTLATSTTDSLPMAITKASSPCIFFIYTSCSLQAGHPVRQ